VRFRAGRWAGGGRAAWQAFAAERARLRAHARERRCLRARQGLWDTVRKKAYRKRTSGRHRLVLGPGLEIAVALYTLLHEAKRGGTAYVHMVTSEVLQHKMALICQDTGARAPRRRGPAGKAVTASRRGLLTPGLILASSPKTARRGRAGTLMKDVPMVVYPDPRKQGYAPSGGAALGGGEAPAAPPRLRPVVFPRDDMSKLNVVQSPGAPPANPRLPAAVKA
jgi:hypothetical protein